MRRNVLLFSLALAGLLAIPASGAKTVVEFTDGRYLEVRAHEVLESWVRLEVERGSMMYVPTRRVEMIQRDEREVYRSPETLIVTAAPEPESEEPTLRLRQHPHPESRLTPRLLPRPPID